jgi:hypothetical protein
LLLHHQQLNTLSLQAAVRRVQTDQVQQVRAVLAVTGLQQVLPLLREVP